MDEDGVMCKCDSSTAAASVLRDGRGPEEEVNTGTVF